MVALVGMLSLQLVVGSERPGPRRIIDQDREFAIPLEERGIAPERPEGSAATAFDFVNRHTELSGKPPRGWACGRGPAGFGRGGRGGRRGWRFDGGRFGYRPHADFDSLALRRNISSKQRHRPIARLRARDRVTLGCRCQLV